MRIKERFLVTVIERNPENETIKRFFKKADNQVSLSTYETELSFVVWLEEGEQAVMNGVSVIADTYGKPLFENYVNDGFMSSCGLPPVAIRLKDGKPEFARGNGDIW